LTVQRISKTEISQMSFSKVVFEYGLSDNYETKT